MSVESFAPYSASSAGPREYVNSIRTTIREKLDGVRAFFKPNETEARELLERVAMRIETRNREDHMRGIHAPENVDLDIHVLERIDRLYGVHINLATHPFTQSEHQNLVGSDDESWGEVSHFQKLIYVAGVASLATSLAAPFIEHPLGVASDTITTLEGPQLDYVHNQNGGAALVETIASYDLGLAFPADKGETTIDIDIIHPGACDTTLYQFDGVHWQAVGHLSTDADVLQLLNVPQSDMALGSDNCSPYPDNPLRLEQFRDDSLAIHMATLIAASDYVTTDPNNIREAREHKGGYGVKIAVVDISFPETIKNQVADFAGSDVTTIRLADSGNDGFTSKHYTHGIEVASRAAGQAVGVAPQASLTLIGFEDAATSLNDGSYKVNSALFYGALDIAVDSSDVVVVSLLRPNEDISPQMSALIEKARALGRFIVFAAGNDAQKDFAPLQALGMDEANPHVIVVGGLNLTGDLTTKAGELNANDGGGTLFPIYSSGYTPEEGNQSDANQHLNDNYRLFRVGGSSYAAPVVAGTIALLLGVDPSLRHRPADVQRILQETSGNLGIDAHAALRQATMEKLGNAINSTAKH